MPVPVRRLLPPLLAGLIAVGSAACGAAGPSPSTSGGASPAVSADAPTPGPSVAASEGPSAPALTPVPGGTSPSPDDSYGGGPTTETEWGRILVNIPDDFPVYPDARTVDPLEEPATAGWFVLLEEVDTVANWYAETMEALGWSRVDLQAPLEDGSRVLDLGTDLPECRAQATFRPADGSTMIIVLYGAGCAGGDG